MAKLCAHCVEERDDCLPVDFDGKTVLMCGECREGEVRGGRYSFGGGDSRRPTRTKGILPGERSK